MKTNVEEIKNNLAKFHGSNTIYHMEGFNFLYSEGVKYVAEACEAVWLLTDSGIQCKYLAKKEDFIVIKLTKNEDNSATLIYTDGNSNELEVVELTRTDFPLEEIEFWFTNNTLLLPSEY